MGRRTILALVLCVLGTVSAAQSLESALMPGKVIQGHAKYEDDCGRCHVRFNRPAQNGLCMNCHVAIAGDIKARRGHHGRLPQAQCSSCHTDHKGRDARVVQLVENRFDHKLTDFPLRGKHAGPRCSKCHEPGAKHRDAPASCSACHSRDDLHKGSLGDKCENCHRDQGWKEVSFDHATTRLPLRGRHKKLACTDCHADKRFSDAPRECQACHRKDDAHKGSFGAACADCHVERDWKGAAFDHDRSTRFALRGRHTAIKCEACHRSALRSVRLAQECVACHRGDDPHQSSLGTRCQRCHNERSWKSAAFDHAKDTGFPLLGGHRPLTCQKCHGAGISAKVSSTCIDCHRNDDAHEGNLGGQCKKCHTEGKWKESTFDHNHDTRFALLDRHRKAPCGQCHKDNRYKDKPPQDCHGCHRQDDRHQGQLGTDCGSCHNARDWSEARFDHSRSRFPLLGSHDKVACKDCHPSRAFKDASVECVACHARQDIHKERLGSRCGQCHRPDRWKSVDFAHDRDTRYKLEGAHARASCTACHTAAVQGNIKLSSACIQCHRKDDVHFASYGARCENCHTSVHWRHVDTGAVNKFLRDRRR